MQTAFRGGAGRAVRRMGVPQAGAAALGEAGGRPAGRVAVKVLLVDDDPQIREVVTIALERAGYGVVTASDGQGALRSARREAPRLVVLDVGLPELDGFEVCRRLRAFSDVPVLFLTARDDEVDRVVGLELGADDYVTKPFSPRELIARIGAILRRAEAGAPAGNGAVPARPMSHGALTIDPGRHGCSFAGRAVALTGTEMALLARLMRRPDQVIGRGQLTDAVYGVGSPVSDRTLDSHLRNLRRKLAEAGGTDAIDTVHGVGIRMGPCRGG